MPRISAKTYNEAMLDIVDRYVDAGGQEPIDLDDLARFAIHEGYWERAPSKLIQLCKRDFAKAFREQYHIDPQGRHVRTYHARKSRDEASTQKVFWADLRAAPPEHMEVAFQQRRNQIAGECRQLKQDVDSYNDNNTDSKFIQMEFNFTDDVAELEQPTEYRPTRPR